MKIELKCPTCESVLRVDAEHAGKQLRCPNCQNLTAIPFQSTAQASKEAPTHEFSQPMDDIGNTQPQYINPPTSNDDSSEETTSLVLGILGIVLGLGCGCFAPILFFVNLYGFMLAMKSTGPLRMACLITNGIAMLISFCIGGFWVASLLMS